MTSKKKKPKHSKRFDLVIGIERDAPTPPKVPEGLYRLRVIINHVEAITPLTSFHTFDEAIRAAWNMKGMLEKRFHRRISAECIKGLKGIEMLIDTDPTLKGYISDGNFVPCRELIPAKLKKGN
jgi:hypothetical protein